MNHVIRARPGFDWSAVKWGGPKERRTDRCSYCGELFPDECESDFVPLMMWKDDGSCAEFCEHCQAAWFGIETLPHPPEC